MKIKTFKKGYKNGWEINLIGESINLRLARYQIGIWFNYKPLVNLLF